MPPVNPQPLAGDVLEPALVAAADIAPTPGAADEVRGGSTSLGRWALRGLLGTLTLGSVVLGVLGLVRSSPSVPSGFDRDTALVVTLRPAETYGDAIVLVAGGSAAPLVDNTVLKQQLQQALQKNKAVEPAVLIEAEPGVSQRQVERVCQVANEVTGGKARLFLTATRP
jgi:hypothetical protein